MEGIKRLFAPERQARTFAALTLVLGIVILLPRLGSYGFWDPQEISVADQARDVVNTGNYGAVFAVRPPLATWLTAVSIATFGKTEWSARLPFALLGLLGALATYMLGKLIARPRAGFYAALILLSSPLYIFQSRQLTSDLATVTFGVIAVLGLVSLVQGARVSAGLLTAVGLVGGFLASGLILGVFVPLTGLAVALLCANESEAAEVRRIGLVLAAASVALLGVALALIFDWTSAQAGQRAILGHALVAAKGYLPLLGGTWRLGDAPATATFDALVKQVAFGMFPWSAVAPLAVLSILTRPASWTRVAMLFWALSAYVIGTLWLKNFGDVRYAALPAIALALGAMLDDLQEDSQSWPLAALFALCAAVQLARDCFNFHDELASVHLFTKIKVPPEVHLHAVVLVFGLIFGACITAWLLRLRRIGTYGLHAALCVGGLFGLFLSWVYTPALSEHFSYRNVFQSYFDHRKGDEPLGVMGIPGSGPEYYAHGPYQKLAGRPDVVSLLERPERVFAIAPASELCAVHQASGAQQFGYHVLDDRNSRFLLLTNHLAAGEHDQNPLLTAVTRTPPGNIQHPLSANFENKIELVGYDAPDAATHGDTFQMTFYFKVLERPTQNYKIFVHFDGVGVRFQADHDPISGRCGTTYWQAGDYVTDTFEVKAGELTHPRGPYSIYTGFFNGGSGQWQNMTVTSGNGDPNNRVTVGSIRVK